MMTRRSLGLFGILLLAISTGCGIPSAPAVSTVTPTVPPPIVTSSPAPPPRSTAPVMPAKPSQVISTATTPELSSSVRPAGMVTITQLLDISFVDAAHGWALGALCAGRGTCFPGIRATTDGGQTWHPVGAPETAIALNGEPGNTHHVRRIRFANPRDGWAFDPGLFTTHDSGATWMEAGLPGEVVAIEPMDGIVWALRRTCSQPGQCAFSLLTSGDQGRTWQVAPVQPHVTGPEAMLVRNGVQDAWILSSGGESSAASSLTATHDGGTTWEELPSACASDNPAVDRLAAADAAHLWLLCGGMPGAGNEMKSLYTSVDGGQHWDRLVQALPGGEQSLPSAGYVADLAFPSLDRGWMALARDTLFGTQDSGHSWHAAFEDQAALAGQGVIRVLFVDAQHGWALGQDSVYRTSDGGLHWESVRVQ